MQPLACYWQGSLATWQAFVEQMTKCFADVQLPEEPEPWQGIRSLDSIIDRLQGAPVEARILCAGCQSSPPGPESLLPAGEAALLWLLGPEGGVRFSRGEWFDAETEHLVTVAERALQQGQLTAPPQCACRFPNLVCQVCLPMAGTPANTVKTPTLAPWEVWRPWSYRPWLPLMPISIRCLAPGWRTILITPWPLE